MQPAYGVLPVEALTAMSLTGDCDTPLAVQVLENHWVLGESPLLLPIQRCGVREIKGHRNLCFDFIYVLAARSTGTREREAQLVLGDGQRSRTTGMRRSRGATIHTS